MTAKLDLMVKNRWYAELNEQEVKGFIEWLEGYSPTLPYGGLILLGYLRLGLKELQKATDD